MRKVPQIIIARIQGKCVGGGVGLAAAADYAIACEGADIKLSELAVGIGPFVVGPAVERKLGLSAFSQLSIDATKWRPADWARKKGLFAELHTDVAGMDDSINRLATTLSKSSADAMKELKQVFWQGTEHWDELLKHDLPWIQLGDVTTDKKTKWVETPTFRNALAILSKAKLFVGTDGGLHHAAAALGIPSVVIWTGFTSSRHLGYDTHRNIHDGSEPCVFL